MRTLHGHPKKLMLVAYAIAGGVVVVMATSWGPRGFVRAWAHPQPAWLLVVGGGAIAALLAYTVSYRALMHFDGGLDLPLGLAARIVALGFGPFVPGGGFDVDKRALEAFHGNAVDVGTRVFAIGALELAVLSPAACACAIGLLIDGDPRPSASVLWPWALAVPAGFLIGFSAMSRLQGRVNCERSGLAGILARSVRGGWMLTGLGRQPRDGWPALIGMAAYWACDIASFYGAARFLGLRINGAEAVLAYATGYALTRRSMPLGGAGVTEALLTLALHWAGQPVGPALAAVLVYRLFNFVFPTLPALVAHGSVDLLAPVDAVDR